MKLNTCVIFFLIVLAGLLHAGPFNKTSFVKNPMIQFKNWLEEAQKEGVSLPEEAILSTASKEGVPFSRGITIRDIDEEGIVFYTNPSSGKWKQMQENPQAVLNFVYDHHQVIVKGLVDLSSLCENYSTKEDGEFTWCAVKLIPYETEFGQLEYLTKDYQLFQSMVYVKNGQDWALSKEPKKYTVPVLIHK
jgi:uncharacterized pyridoxamine 5'-phosphate oxidase family protein